MAKQRKPLRSPNIKHKKAVAELVENGGNLSKALKAAGYSKSIQKNPQRVTRSESFIALLDEIGVNDKKLADKLNEGLDATKAVVMGIKSDESFVDVQPDFAVRHKYLETGLKMRGLAQIEQNTFNFNFASDEINAKFVSNSS